MTTDNPIKSWIEERRAILSRADLSRGNYTVAAMTALGGLPRALDAIERVRELHVKGHETAGAYWCSECETKWPCMTVQAIEGAISHD